MSDTATPLPSDHPAMIAWEQYKRSDYYANAVKWARYPEHVDGSLWSAFWNAYATVVAERDQAREWFQSAEEQRAKLQAERDALARDMQGVRAVQRWMQQRPFTHYVAFNEQEFESTEAHKFQNEQRNVGADSLPALGHQLIAGGHVDAE